MIGPEDKIQYFDDGRKIDICQTFWRSTFIYVKQQGNVFDLQLLFEFFCNFISE